jgi:hypothetical protein
MSTNQLILSQFRHHHEQHMPIGLRIDEHRMCMKDNQKKVLILSFGTTMAMVPRERYETSQDFAGLKLLSSEPAPTLQKESD